jgi:hypothetical protein
MTYPDAFGPAMGPPDTPDVTSAEVPDVPRPSGRDRAINLLAQYNPFYFLSACCMLLGIFVLNDSLDWSPLPEDNLLILIGTLNVYELALVILAAVLLRRGLVRDGMFLLFLEAFFLADAGFLNMEIFTSDPWIGLVVNVALLVLAILKVAMVFLAAGIPLRGGLFPFVLAQIALLLAIPGVFSFAASSHGGQLPMLAVYGAWWAAALVPILYLLMAQRRRLDGLAAKVATTFVALPFVSLLAHLCLANWVNKVPFHPANVAPMLLALAAWVGRYDTHVATLGWRMRMHLALPFTAVALSAIKFPPEMTFDVLGTEFSPLRLTLLAAAMTYVDGFILHEHPNFFVAALMCFAGSGVGTSVRDMSRNTADFVRYVFDGVGRVVPKTASQWGVVSVVGAFVLLAMGAGLSLLKGGGTLKREAKLD